MRAPAGVGPVPLTETEREALAKLAFTADRRPE